MLLHLLLLPLLLLLLLLVLLLVQLPLLLLSNRVVNPTHPVCPLHHAIMASLDPARFNKMNELSKQSSEFDFPKQTLKNESWKQNLLSEFASRFCLQNLLPEFAFRICFRIVLQNLPANSAREFELKIFDPINIGCALAALAHQDSFEWMCSRCACAPG